MKKIHRKTIHMSISKGVETGIFKKSIKLKQRKRYNNN